jgi:hypothetical protein
MQHDAAVHTPGPWIVDRYEVDKIYIIADQGKRWDNPVVCSLFQDVTPADSVTLGPWLEAYENDQANARLIASAPDLLAALKEAVRIIDIAFDYNINAFRIDHNDAVDALLDARSVIAKATGETK